MRKEGEEEEGMQNEEEENEEDEEEGSHDTVPHERTTTRTKDINMRADPQKAVLVST
jgi:hypothetical protein